MSQQASRLSGSTVFWYGAGFAPTGILVTATTFLVFYYNQVIGLPGALVGGALLAASLFDAITDPPVGVLSDRTRSRWGRRHPYMLLFAVPAALLFALLWMPPTSFGTQALIAWIAGLLLLGRLVDTLVTVPYLALGAELSRDYLERTRITTVRAVMFNVGRAGSGALLLLVFLRPTAEYPDGQLNPAAYPPFGILMGFLVAGAILASAWGTRDRIPSLSAPDPPPALGNPLVAIVREMRDALRLRAFRTIFAASVTKNVAWGVSDALGLYMSTYFWKVGTEGLFFWGVGMFTGTFVGLPFWRRVAESRDKRSIYLLGSTIYVVFMAGPYLLKSAGLWVAEDSALHFPLYFLTTGLIAHFGGAAAGALHGSMLGDVTDLDELETGRRREGVIFGAESFGYKAMRGIGLLVAGLVVDFAGLEAGMAPESVSPEVVARLGLAQGCVILGLVGGALFMIARYDLDRARHEQVLAQLAARTG